MVPPTINAAAIPAIGFRVDTVSPAAAIDQPANASFVATSSPQLRATLADAGDAPSGIDPASVRVELDGVDRSAAFDDKLANRDADRTHRVARSAIETVIEMLFQACFSQIELAIFHGAHQRQPPAR